MEGWKLTIDDERWTMQVAGCRIEEAAAAVDFGAAFGESPIIIIYSWFRIADPWDLARGLLW
jgi:hypothetical protein